MGMSAEERAKIRQMEMEGDEVTNESLEATRRIRRLAEESQEVGAETMVKLNEQGEQLNRVEDHLDGINDNLKKAEGEIHEMEKCCGCCVCPWNKTVNVRDRHEMYESADQKGRKEPKGKGKGKGVTSTQPGATDGPSGGKFIKTIDPNDAREDEMNENIGAVSGIVGNLKNLALDMGDELESQNRQLDRLNNKADLNESRLEEDNKRVTKLIKST